MAVAQRDRDIACWRLWLVRSARPGFDSNYEQAGEQQHNTDGMQGFIVRKRELYGCPGGKVTAC